MLYQARMQISWHVVLIRTYFVCKSLVFLFSLELYCMFVYLFVCFLGLQVPVCSSVFCSQWWTSWCGSHCKWLLQLDEIQWNSRCIDCCEFLRQFINVVLLLLWQACLWYYYGRGTTGVEMQWDWSREDQGYEVHSSRQSVSSDV